MGVQLIVRACRGVLSFFADLHTHPRAQLEQNQDSFIALKWCVEHGVYPGDWEPHKANAILNKKKVYLKKHGHLPGNAPRPANAVVTGSGGGGSKPAPKKKSRKSSKSNIIDNTVVVAGGDVSGICLLYTSPSPRDRG